MAAAMIARWFRCRETAGPFTCQRRRWHRGPHRHQEADGSALEWGL